MNGITLMESLVLLGILIFVWYTASRSRNSRYGEYGTRPRIVPYRIPFGLDTLWEAIKYNNRNANHELVMKNIERTGATTFQEFNIGGSWQIMTVEPENMKALFSTKFNDFGKGTEMRNNWKFFLGDGIATSDGEFWVKHRTWLSAQFDGLRIANVELFEPHISKMISMLPKDGGTIDLMDWWYRFALDASTEYLFGQCVDSLSNPKASFSEAFRIVQEVQALRFRIGPLWRIYYPNKFVSSMKLLNDFIAPVVIRALGQSSENVEKRRSSDQGVCIADSLAQYHKDGPLLRDQLMNLLLGGRDTIAANLSWLFYELSYHPDVYAKLRKEIFKTLGEEGKKPTYEELKSMSYLRYCLNEVHRLYPIIPFNVRTALVDTSLPRGGGPSGLDPIEVPKGTQCNYSPFVMQRRTDIFGPTVDDFNPSRWESWTPEPWTYLPFNRGPRKCLGKDFAFAQMGYVTVRMCQTFAKLEERSGQPRGSQGYRTDILLTPAAGVKVGLLPHELKE